MSGIEVVGVVLGVLPLAIEALKAYRSMLSRVRGADRDLKALIQDLETEQVRLRTTCEVLLDGLAPLSKIDDLVEKPFGSEWDQFHDDIRVRLWTATEKFKEQAKEMQEAAEELRDKLCIEADGKAKLNSLEAIVRQFKQKASFSLKKKDYEGIISRIKTANSVLRDLAGQNCSLEPSRRRRSQARVTKLIRGLSRSIFEALRSAATCRCTQSHDVCLELVPRKAVMLPSDVEDEVAKNLVFHVMLGSYESLDTDCNSPNEGTVCEEKVRSLDCPSRWDSLRVQFVSKSEHPLPLLLNVPNQLRSQSLRKRVRFRDITSQRELSFSSTETLAVVSERSFPVATAPPTAACPPALNSDLCRAVSTWHKECEDTAVDCCGYIADPHRRFGIYPQHRHSQLRSTITLRQILERKKTEAWTVDHMGKLRIALAISISVLHLYSTPWLARTLTLDDVIFLQGSQRLPCYPDFTIRPFMLKNFTRSEEVSREAASLRQSVRAMNLTVLSLGAMLIQVIIGQAVPALDMVDESSMDLNTILEKNEVGRKFRDEVLQSGGINYMTAVKWCLESVLGITGLNNEDFCQNFYEEVVVRLETDIQQLCS
ncbi:hypothetical protein QQZ08_007565 [Neonectria magnoliae]|uniref:DUF7580 domain-containing protein n=1 Tax=Neonectria magnoliae TaxID=2732573 RepID=A0ABR1HXQ4_9HYPO